MGVTKKRKKKMNTIDKKQSVKVYRVGGGYEVRLELHTVAAHHDSVALAYARAACLVENVRMSAGALMVEPDKLTRKVTFWSESKAQLSAILKALVAHESRSRDARDA